MKVKIISEWHQGSFNKDDIGEIVGFAMGGDGRPYTVVCCNKRFDYVPIYCIEKLEEE